MTLCISFTQLTTGNFQFDFSIIACFAQFRSFFFSFCLNLSYISLATASSRLKPVNLLATQIKFYLVCEPKLQVHRALEMHSMRECLYAILQEI